MAKGDRDHWMELCKAASETRDDQEFLKIVRELNEILEREEQMRRELRKTAQEKKRRQELQC